MARLNQEGSSGSKTNSFAGRARSEVLAGAVQQKVRVHGDLAGFQFHIHKAAVALRIGHRLGEQVVFLRVAYPRGQVAAVVGSGNETHAGIRRVGTVQSQPAVTVFEGVNGP